MKNAVGLLTLALLLTGCATERSQPMAEATPRVAQTAAPAASALPAAPDDGKMVCRNEPVVGSKYPERICMTNRQRREQQARARAYRDEAGQQRDTRNGLGQ